MVLTSQQHLLRMTLLDTLVEVANRHKMFLLLLILTCGSHMHLLGSQGRCMTLMCYFMHLRMIMTNFHTLPKVCMDGSYFFSYCFQIILHAPRNIFKFPHLYLGKYYHVDAGYPNRSGYLAPYKGQRYHVPEWRRGPAPSGEQELFNNWHSSI